MYVALPLEAQTKLVNVTTFASAIEALYETYYGVVNFDMNPSTRVVWSYADGLCNLEVNHIQLICQEIIDERGNEHLRVEKIRQDKLS